MARYDNLDARTELEQAITDDLRSALSKRGFTVVHNGTTDSHAPSGLPDIMASSRSVVLTFEATKSRGAQQDRELNSIRDHLNQVKMANGNKRCYALFVSSASSFRMLDGIRDHNHQRANERRSDLKILPLCFDTLQVWVTRLRESEADLYPVNDFLKIFENHADFIDDLRIRKLLFQNVFPHDTELAQVVEREEIERDQRTLETLIKDLARMEDYMRQNGIAVGHAAIDTLIYLVFMKLYEEKREQRGDNNRLRSEEAFEQYRRDSVDEPSRRAKRAIHRLFDNIKQEGEFLSSGMFTPGDNLPDSLNDDFIQSKVIPIFSQYRFVGTRIDALGAVYEVLALRAEKDVKVGQFFTPENVVRFMVRLAELDYTDLILDPACGTGRFLIYAMDDMLAKVERPGVRQRAFERDQVRFHRLFGADIDPRIAKIAKMNMWIHGDGKSNIFGGPDYNGMTLHKHPFNGHRSFDDSYDVVLTNPPLGELNYQVITFFNPEDDASPGATLQTLLKKITRMPILPRKNITEERLKAIRERLQTYRQEYAALQGSAVAAQEDSIIQEWLRLRQSASTTIERHRLRELKQMEPVKAYERICAAAERKLATIHLNESQESSIEAELRAEQIEWEITGNTMKGGALYLAAIWHYLKGNAYPDNPPEWRGGKVLIILDEGILNTDNYREVRNFLQSHFYIKAVISLTRDTFVPVSNTSTKTSILYAVKKTDLQAVQKEPIYFAHADKVGLTTVAKVCQDHLPIIFEKYREFKQVVLESYLGAEFRRDKFMAHDFKSGQVTDDSVEPLVDDSQNYFFKAAQEGRTILFYREADQVLKNDRLHYLFFHPKLTTIENFLITYETTPLSHICREAIIRGEQPQYDDFGTIDVLKTIDLKNRYIDYENCLKVSQEYFDAHPNAQVRRHDILVASTGYGSMGKVDVYDRDEPATVDGHIAILRVNDDYDPYFVAYFLRSHLGQLQFEKWFTGSSGQIELQPADLGKILVPASNQSGIPLDKQQVIAAAVTVQLRQALALEQQASAKWREGRQSFHDTLFSKTET